MPDVNTMREVLTNRKIINHRGICVCDVRANMSTVSNEMVMKLYAEIFGERKSHHKRDVLVDTFRGPRHPGKTARDHASGAEKRRMDNQKARANWKGSRGDFPSWTCNGKRNRRKVGKPS